MIFCMYVKSHFNIIMFTQEDQQRYNKLFKSIFMQKMQFLFSNPKYLYAIAGQKPSCSVVGVLTTRFQVEIIQTPVFQLLTKVLDTHLKFFILKSDSLSVIVNLPVLSLPVWSFTLSLPIPHLSGLPTLPFLYFYTIELDSIEICLVHLFCLSPVLLVPFLLVSLSTRPFSSLIFNITSHLLSCSTS